jgi:hypothetical protein
MYKGGRINLIMVSESSIYHGGEGVAEQLASWLRESIKRKEQTLKKFL